jgi:hypothetical protein
MSKKCNTCKQSGACPHSDCQAHICWRTELHLNAITDDEVAAWECYEVDPDIVEQNREQIA